jgi:hypothetical protein
VGAVQVNRGTRRGMVATVAVGVRSLQAMIDVKSVACRQAIEPTHRHRLVSLNLYHRPGITAVITPYGSPAEVPVKHLAGLRHNHFQRLSASWPQNRRDGQRLAEFSQTAAFILFAPLDLQEPAALGARGDHSGSCEHTGFDEYFCQSYKRSERFACRESQNCSFQLSQNRFKGIFK